MPSRGGVFHLRLDAARGRFTLHGSVKQQRGASGGFLIPHRAEFFLDFMVGAEAQIGVEGFGSRGVAARPIEAGDQTQCDRIAAGGRFGMASLDFCFYAAAA